MPHTPSKRATFSWRIISMHVLRSALIRSMRSYNGRRVLRAKHTSHCTNVIEKHFYYLCVYNTCARWAVSGRHNHLAQCCSVLWLRVVKRILKWPLRKGYIWNQRLTRITNIPVSIKTLRFFEIPLFFRLLFEDEKNHISLMFKTRSKIRDTFLFHEDEKICHFQVSLYRHVYTFSYTEFDEEFEFAIFNANWSWDFFLMGLLRENKGKWPPDFGFLDVKKKSHSKLGCFYGKNSTYRPRYHH